MMEDYYMVLSTLTFWLLFSVWKLSSPLNVTIKLALLALALVGSLSSLHYLGYVVAQ